MIGVFRLGASESFRRLDEIDRLGMSHSKEGERERYFAKMRDGETVDLLEHDRNALLRRPMQLLPAEPGWSIIRVNDRCDEPWTMREPVIGWAICFDGEFRPVAPNGIPNDSKRCTYVEMPSGRIEGVTEWADPFTFENAAEMTAHFAGAKTEALEEGALHPGTIGDCRRHPPTISQALLKWMLPGGMCIDPLNELEHTLYPASAFPVSHKSSWCGEFEPHGHGESPC